MKLIAHRGFADEHPENTVRAVRRASDVADAVEVDVRRCGSGELVVFHDETVDRVTDGIGAVSEYDLPHLRALTVLDSGESVPTLTAVLAAVPESIAIVVDLKEPVADDALELLEMVDNDVVISAFDPSILRTVSDLDPTVPTALVWDGNGGDPVDRARDLGCRSIHPEWSLCEEGFVKRAHSADLRVNAWPVKRTSTATDLRSLGVDGVIADDSHVL